MAWKLLLAAEAAAETFMDRTSIVDWTTLRTGGVANRVEVDAGSGFDLADDAGDIDLPTHRVVLIVEDSTTPDTVLGRHRVISRGLARGLMPVGDATQFDVMLTDANSHLSGIPISRRGRPEEYDYERVQWLLEEWLQGTPRPSTDLVDTYLSTDNGVLLEAKSYTETTPAGILADICEQTGKEAFVTVDNELFFDEPESTAYAASLSITDEGADSVTSFAPIDPRVDEDGSEFYTGVLVVYGADRRFVYVTRSDVEEAHDRWRWVIVDESIKTEAAAIAKANLYLDERDHDERRIHCSIKLWGDQVDLIKYGQTVSFRSAATKDTTPVTLRVKRLVWEMLRPGMADERGVYIAHLELGFPAKLAARSTPGSGNPGSAPPNTTPPPPYNPGAPTYEPPITEVAVEYRSKLVAPAGSVQFLSDGDDILPGDVSHPIPNGFEYLGAPFDRRGFLITRPMKVDLYYLIGTSLASGFATVLYSELRVNGLSVATVTDPWSAGLMFRNHTNEIALADYVLKAGDLVTVYSIFTENGTPRTDTVSGGAPSRLEITDIRYRASPGEGPVPGQPVNNDEAWMGDGVRRDGQTNHAYIRGTLRVLHDGIEESRRHVIEIDPAMGKYRLTYVPSIGSLIEHFYDAA